MEELDAISSSSGSNDPYSDNDDQIPTGDAGGGGIHQENEVEEEAKETDEEIKQDLVKEEEEAKETDEEIKQDLSKEAEEKTDEDELSWKEEDEFHELEKDRCDKEAEILRKMLESDKFTGNEKDLLHKTLEECMLYKKTLHQWTKLAEDDAHLVLTDTKIPETEWDELFDAYQEFLSEIGDEDTLEKKKKTVKESFDKMMKQIEEMDLRNRGNDGEYFAKPPQLPEGYSFVVEKLLD